MIKNRVLKTEEVDWRKLQNIQTLNFKELTTEAYEKLKQSILKNDYVMPLAVWQNGKDIYLIDGVHRLRVMTELEKEGVELPKKLPANFLECKDRKAAAKLVLVYSSIYANVTNEGLYEFINLEGLNFDDLKLEIDIPELDMDKFEIGWMKDEEQLDEVPEPQKDAVSKTGDIFLLDGKHRVMCGDSTKREDVEKLMDGKKIKLLLTDPPYGVNYSAKNVFLNSIAKGNRIQKDIQGDTDNIEDTVACWRGYFRNAKANMDKGANFYINFSGDKLLLLLLLLLLREKEINLPEKQILVWVKNNHVLGRSNYNYKHEFILYGWNEGCHKFYGDFDTTVWEVDKPLKNDLHPTMKPIALLVKAIGHGADKGMIVYDGFLGSGSTLIACEQTNRICYGMEIDPIYIDVSLRRYAKLYPDKKIECLIRGLDCSVFYNNI